MVDSTIGALFVVSLTKPTDFNVKTFSWHIYVDLAPNQQYVYKINHDFTGLI